MSSTHTRTADTSLESALHAMGARPRRPPGHNASAMPTLTDEWRQGVKGRAAAPPDVAVKPGTRSAPVRRVWPRWRLVVLATLLAALTVLVAAGLAQDRASWLHGPGPDLAKAAAAAASPVDQTLAVVNGKSIVADEIAGQLASGVERAVAIDRTINKAVAADAARSVFPEQARDALRTAEREVLASLYLQRRTQELMQAIDDTQVAAYYADKVHDEDYAAYTLRYYLTRDPADAASVKALLDSGDRAAQSRLAPLSANGQRQLPPQAVPYGLGQIVRKAKAGEVVEPMLVRDGYLLLVLDERRDGRKPALAEVKNDIRAAMADRQLGDELREWRQKARIELR